MLSSNDRAMWVVYFGMYSWKRPHYWNSDEIKVAFGIANSCSFEGICTYKYTYSNVMVKLHFKN